MVAYFEHVGTERSAGDTKEIGLLFVFGVPHEEKRTLTVRDSNHERIVVRAAVDRQIRTRGRVPRFARRRPCVVPYSLGMEYGDAAVSHLNEKRGVVSCVPSTSPPASIPESAETDARETAPQSPKVIGMRMRQHRHRHVAPPPRTENGREDSLARIDRATDQAAAIDHHRAAVGKIDDRRVSLANVEKRDA